jgi:peptidoglycan hydrolase-like protein with peptidoglycan-binding domain
LFNSQPWESFRTYNGPVEVFGPPGNRLLKLMEPILFGEDVRRLQAALLQAGFNIGSEKPDGFFGEKTDKAVRQFQQQKRLKVDGIVGQQTLQALGL